jgi:hypothetical protein
MSKKLNDVDIPDSIRPYLNEIAEHLWAARAAVMVGAGFSKNAGKEFPNWNQLGDLFYEKAYGVKPDLVKQKCPSVPQLASEVQALIGKTALDNMLCSNIPDASFEPSKLHVKLLELPWVDVFTTNYDTLLERANNMVVTRQYDLVVNQEDIRYAVKPRIVKLHGSLSSEHSKRHLIITEEDYRRYPSDYALFVNTVQQALLENTFCLIGFSGDDPNFLQWIGWIRDNLGKDKTQKIYLVGVFDLSPARLQLLMQRGITVVDLSCCGGIEKDDHEKALTLFFDYIWSQKSNIHDWAYDYKIIRPDIRENCIKNIQEITEEWRRQRQDYPGWLILLYSDRKSLWMGTIAWVDYLPGMEKSPLGLDIQYAFELIWRLEKCLLPIFNNIAVFCEKLLEKYWPFPNENKPANCQICSGDEKYQDLPWNDLQQAWLAIAVAMLRFYREGGYLEKWEETETQLKNLSEYLSVEQREFLNYESFLFSLFTLNLPDAKQRLENWRPNETQPYWMAKRAAALAEIGLLGEAETDVKDALENIRKKQNQKVAATDLTLVSLESNAMLLGKHIQDAVASKKGEWEKQRKTRMQFNDRWNELKRFKYDIGNEIKLFELALKNPPIERKNVTEKRGFDIGKIIRTRHFPSADQEGLNAYAFLRFCEEIGLPYRIGNSTFATKTASTSLQRILKYSPFWAFATLVRLGDERAVDSLFSREDVYKFTVDEADKFIENYLDALDKCRDDIQAGDASRNDNYGVRLAKLLPEIMSRLCCKCSVDMKHRFLEFITGVYASPTKNNYRNVGGLLKRLLSSMTEVEQYNLIPELLKIPFPENLNLLTKNEFLNPFLLLGLNQRPKWAEQRLKIDSGLVEHLFSQVTSDNPDRRRWAIASLITLHKLDLFADDQRKKLAAAIWRVTDEYGLPNNADFYKFAFLELPYPGKIDPIQLFKEYVKVTPLPSQKNKQGGFSMIGEENISIVHEIIGANDNDENFWTVEEVTEILRRLLEWWDVDKDLLKTKKYFLKNFPSTVFKELQTGFTCVLELLAEVVGPKFSPDSPRKIITSLRRLLNEVRDYGLPCLTAEAACLHIYPDQTRDVYKRINEALVSNQDDIRKDGLNAIAKLILDSKNDVVSSEESEPISMLSQYLTWSPTRSISSALWIVIRILRNLPDRFFHGLEAATNGRLNRLLADTAYDSDNPDLNFDEKLEVKRTSSILAATLWKHYDSQGLPIPEVIEKWHEVCLDTNEFAEIKNAWKDHAGV